MKRCEAFNIWFEDHKRKSGHLTPTVIPTTAPWPPIGLQYTYNSICAGCGQDLNKLTHYVCYMPNCPSQMRVTCSTSTVSQNTPNLNVLNIPEIQPLTTLDVKKMKRKPDEF